MTLVIGASAMAGIGAIVSDIRVSFPDGSSRDMLRKAYPVGNHIAAGFAGSVAIGFALLEDLTVNLKLPRGSETSYWLPHFVADAWQPVASEIFAKHPEHERRLGSRVLLAGTDPTDSGVRLIRFASPDFKPQFIRRGLRTCSIGSGASDQRYMRAIRPHFDIRT